MAELLILNVVVDGNNVASVSLAEPFAAWAKRSKVSDGGLDHSNLEHLINALMRSPQVIEQSRRFSAMRYKKDPIHATLFSDAIAY